LQHILLLDLLLHVGRGGDHMPVTPSGDTHSLWSAPTSAKPSLQVWLTTDPKVVDLIVLPLAGVPGSPQSITMRIVKH